MTDPAVLYKRELPGGGYVTIEELDSDETIFRARLWVERRTDPTRRLGHVPPVIAEAHGENRATVYEQLFRIAADNVAVARGILRWQANRSREGKGGPR
jgi:hypothetical protein